MRKDSNIPFSHKVRRVVKHSIGGNRIWAAIKGDDTNGAGGERGGWVLGPIGLMRKIRHVETAYMSSVGVVLRGGGDGNVDNDDDGEGEGKGEGGDGMKTGRDEDGTG